MKRFQFPLERVRRWRREQANLEELKLQQLRAELARLEAAKREVEMEVTQSARRVLEQATIDALELTSLECYREFLRYRAYQLGNLARQCEAKIVEQRGRVIEARRQFELLDRLHGKAWREWLAEGNKEQEQLAAEMFLAKSVRGR